MFWNLLGTLILGVGTVGTVLIAYRILGRKTPGWLPPMTAGLAMLGFQLWLDYTWHQRAVRGLPDTFRVVKTYSDGSILAPWTYVLAPVNRFAAIDLASVRRNKQASDFAMAQIYLISRYRSNASGMQIFDCAGARRADLGPATKFGGDGLPENAAWSALPAGDRALTAVCGVKR